MKNKSILMPLYENAQFRVLSSTFVRMSRENKLIFPNRLLPRLRLDCRLRIGLGTCLIGRWRWWQRLQDSFKMLLFTSSCKLEYSPMFIRNRSGP